jgi:zinc transport system substrate-binding protein
MTSRLKAPGGTLCSADSVQRWVVGAAIALLASLSPGFATAGEADVVVTIKPIHSLVARVMEGVGTPLLLVDGKASPHSFSLRPSQVQAVGKANVFIRVSERLEPFTAKLTRILPRDVELISLIDAPGVKLLEQRQSGAFDEHDHRGEAHAPSADHGSADSHIWLDPDNAKAIGAYVAGVLAKRFPESAARFKSNAEHLNADIDALTAELSATTRPLQGKPFVVFHDAYQYFDRRFDLDAVGSITITPDVQPSARRLIELREKIRELKAVCVFAEPLFQPRLVAALTEGTDARAGTLDPEGLGLDAGPGLYFVLMRNLAGSLKSCLAPSS